MKYRKKPLLVEAFQYDGDFMKSSGEICVPDWMLKAPYFFKGQGDLYINNDGNLILVNVGDYVIKGVKGEVYPCKPDIFELTYETIKE